MPSRTDTTRSYRLPVAVGPGQISVDGITVAFVPNDSSSLLRNYLRLVRSIRRQKRAPDVALRRDDIEVLAEYLDEAGEVVLDRLAALMGVTRTQRTAMLTLFASGALVIGLSTSTAASSTSTSDSVGPRRADIPAGPDATVVEAEARSLSPAAAVVVVTTTEASQATVVGADTAVPPAVVVATAEAAPAPVSSTPAVVIPVSSAGATVTTTGGQPQRDVAAGTPAETTEPSVVVAVAETPIATDVSIIDSGTPPPPPNVSPATPPTTPATTSASTPTSPGGVGEPPLDEPTPPIIDPSLVDVGAPPVPTTAQSNTTVVGP